MRPGDLHPTRTPCSNFLVSNHVKGGIIMFVRCWDPGMTLAVGFALAPVNGKLVSFQQQRFASRCSTRCHPNQQAVRDRHRHLEELYQGLLHSTGTGQSDRC